MVPGDPVVATGELALRQVLEARNRVLTGIARGAPLSDVLMMQAQECERLATGVLCSVLLLDPATRRLRHGVAPSLPAEYCRAVDGLEIGPGRGSCGAAAYSGERVVVEDVLTHPNWAPYLPLVKAAGLRACWSEPIVSSTAEVLGTFAMYYREPRLPNDDELEFIRRTAQVAGIAIERARATEALERHRRGLEEEVRRRTAELEEANRALRETLREVSTLRGLLPICMSCKRARDGQGYWEEIELYLAQRSEAVIAQGICPECRDKVFSPTSSRR